MKTLEEKLNDGRKRDLIAIYQFLVGCDVEELASIVNEINTVHSNLFAWNMDTRLFAKIESVSINGDDIQLNIEAEQP